MNASVVSLATYFLFDSSMQYFTRMFRSGKALMSLTPFFSSRWSVREFFIFCLKENSNVWGISLVVLPDSHADRSVGEKKPRTSGDEGPSMTELSGYNFKRQEFEIEYDNDAEQLLADMEFKDTDTDAERELKLRVLHIYLKR